jgi:hypothetical protein
MKLKHSNHKIQGIHLRFLYLSVGLVAASQYAPRKLSKLATLTEVVVVS